MVDKPITQTSPATVVSGIRATGRMHLGNYLGVLRRFATMSRDECYECCFFVADLHSLTTMSDGQLIRAHLPNIVLDYLAAGVDPERTHLYVQSDVPQVAELTWYLSCMTSVSDLTGLPTFKEKAAMDDNPNAGLLCYPVLMAADILGPRAHFVPVGKDQKPHLELAQKLAMGFNRLYVDFFPRPDALVEEMLLIPGLSAKTERGFSKMGKSEGNTLNLADTPEQTWEKIKSAPTDPKRVRRTDPGTPEDCAVHAIHEFVSSEERLHAVREGCRSADIGCVECKGWLSESVNDTLREFRDRRVQLAERPSIVRDVLAIGAEAIRPRFDETLRVVRDCLGIARHEVAP